MAVKAKTAKAAVPITYDTSTSHFMIRLKKSANLTKSLRETECISVDKQNSKHTRKSAYALSYSHDNGCCRLCPRPFCLLVGCTRPSNMHEYLRDESASKVVRSEIEIAHQTSPSHTILTPGQPVFALTL